MNTQVSYKYMDHYHIQWLIYGVLLTMNQELLSQCTAVILQL